MNKQYFYHYHYYHHYYVLCLSECQDSSWDCTEDACEGVCYATGDPHYITFNGKMYDFMGKCEYYLVKMEWADFYIKTANEACGKQSTAIRGTYRA